MLAHKTVANRAHPFVTLAVVLACGTLQAAAGTIDFENQSDGTIVTTQYPGLTLTNAIILSAGVSLNEFELPPHSGVQPARPNRLCLQQQSCAVWGTRLKPERVSRPDLCYRHLKCDHRGRSCWRFVRAR